MAEQPNKNSTATQWIEALNAEAIDEAREEACVDAYDEYEQHSGFMTALEELLNFPFSAKGLGDVMTVVAMKWPVQDSKPPTNYKKVIREIGVHFFMTGSYAAALCTERTPYRT